MSLLSHKRGILNKTMTKHGSWTYVLKATCPSFIPATHFLCILRLFLLCTYLLHPMIRRNRLLIVGVERLRSLSTGNLISYHAVQHSSLRGVPHAHQIAQPGSQRPTSSFSGRPRECPANDCTALSATCCSPVVAVATAAPAAIVVEACLQVGPVTTRRCATSLRLRPAPRPFKKSAPRRPLLGTGRERGPRGGEANENRLSKKC